jgi:host factor-I protein
MAFRSSNQDSSSRHGRALPPEDTHEEAAYLKTLGEKQRPVCVKLLDGTIVRGWIEYYDRRMVRLTREGQPNLFIFKHEIAYIAEEEGRPPRPQNPPDVKRSNSTGASE